MVSRFCAFFFCMHGKLLGKQLIYVYFVGRWWGIGTAFVKFHVRRSMRFILTEVMLMSFRFAGTLNGTGDNNFSGQIAIRKWVERTKFGWGVNYKSLVNH